MFLRCFSYLKQEMEGSGLVLLSGHSSAVLSMWCQIDNIQQRHHLVANDQLHSLPTLL